MNDPALMPDSCKVLVLFPNWLGDAVMATGLLDVLDGHRDLPDGRRLHLTLGIRRAWAPLFLNDRRCDDFLLIERTGKHAGVGGLIRLRGDLVAGGFEAAVLGPPSLRVALAAALARIPVRVGYSGDGRRSLLAPCLPRPNRGSIHYAQEMRFLGRALLEQLGLTKPDPDVSSGTYLPGCADISSDPRNGDCPRWILAPGATFGQAKTWPLEQALQFSRLVLEQERAELILLGDAGAGSFAGEMARHLGIEAASTPQGRPGLVDLTGKTTLEEVVALLKSAAAFVGNDSGLMHLSAALGLATLGIFGSSNPAWTAPQGPRARALVALGFPCQPCYRKTCNQPKFCLDTVAGSEVLAAMNDLLGDASAQQGEKS